MADWKKLLKQIILMDEVIDTAEVKLLEAEILADGVVDEEEVEFLADLRNSAKSACPEFPGFFFGALRRHFLADGVIDSNEVVTLKRVLWADGVIDDDEKRFLKELKSGAKSTVPEFDAFLKEAVG